MAFLKNEFYHIYNQGNNKVKIFYTNDNYLYFLSKVRELIKPHCDILAYCLMPNHYHFLVVTNEKSVKLKKVGSLELTELSNGIRILTSSYAQALNKKLGNTGALFRPKTKHKIIEYEQNGYLQTAFDYIHKNPIASGLVEELKHWPYSSYLDFAGFRNGTLCNIELAKKYIEF
ncbi:MAG: transposase [Bacteroidota bacterium]|nr:transposase [Bacteroidota bacterium]